jgi:hypothetical protein
MNPAPDMDIYSLTPSHFDWVVQAMADMAIDLALHPAGLGPPRMSRSRDGRRVLK